MKLLSPICLWLTVALLVSTPNRADDWPAFRGRDGDGRSQETGIFESPGALRLEVRWKRPLGSAYSGIAVVGGRLYTQATGDSDLLLALDAASGATLWQLPLGAGYRGHDGSHSGPLATPVVGPQRVFALGPRGDLVAADAMSGKELWRIQLADDHGARKPHYGFSASPRLFGDILVVPLGGYQRAVAGFDAATGELRWSAGSDAIQYQSPVAWPPGDEHRALIAGTAQVFALDTRQGTVLWQFHHGGFGTRGADSLSPVPVGKERLFLTHRDDASTLIEVQPGGSVSTVWESRAVRNSYALPVVHDGDLYAFSSRFLTCVDSRTGEARWRSRAPGDGFPILVDGHLVIQTKAGGLHVARASPRGYEERASVALFSDHSWTSPSFADGAIYARSLGEIARVDPISGNPSVIISSPQVPLGQLLSDLEKKLASAPDQQAVVDRFLAAQDSFPIVEGQDVYFVYRGPAEDVALAGDLPGTRREWPLRRLADSNLFGRFVPLEAEATISYLYLVDYEPTPDPLNPQQVRSSVYDRELEPVTRGRLEMSWLAMPEAPAAPKSGEHSAGTLLETAFTSQRLNRELELAVYRPDVPRKRRLPVVYIFGGRGALEAGRLRESLDASVGQTIEPLMAVFVLEDGFSSLATFADMFVQELVPFVDAEYRTRAEPSARAAVGMGWEALTAAYCTLKRPGVVGKLALQSIYALTIPEGGPESWLSSPTTQPLEVYVDWGKYDLRNSHEAWSTAEDSRRFFESLRANGYAPHGGEVAAGAGWPSWRRRTHLWLEALFPARQ